MEDFPGGLSEDQGVSLRGSGQQRCQSGFPHQTRQGAQGVQDIRQEEQGFRAEQTKNRHAFEAPAFKSGIAPFHGIAGTRIEAFPGRATHWDIPDQADGSIGETLTHIDDPTMGLIGQVKALRGRVSDLFEFDLGFFFQQASPVTGPFVAVAFTIEAIGDREYP